MSAAALAHRFGKWSSLWSGGLTGLPVRCWRARLKWRVRAVANRSYEAEMRAAGVSAAIYERKKQAPRGLVYRYGIPT